MIIIGERINSSRKVIAEAVKNRDAVFLANEAKEQEAAGADMIDLNVGTFVGQEPELMGWLVEIVQDVVSVPLCIDTPSADTIESALEKCKSMVVVNSITGETERYSSFLPLIRKYGSSVIALCMDDRGLSRSPEVRCEIGLSLIEQLTKAGVPYENIYIDPVVEPISCGPNTGRVCLDSIRLIRSQEPEVHIICGLRNVSYGLPKRALLDESFLSMAVLMGLDTVILNPLNKRLMAGLRAARALVGSDEYCMDYIAAYRKGKLEC
ncbi:MAG: dihydropteroate synthase [Gemmatimonadota bacterium]|nr:MAG: dihydropteroate synthase [Gemmatimonadota bacterium]